MAEPANFYPFGIAGLVGWYDFSDADMLYTDAARTTKVSADGNSINGIRDKSPAGNHLVSVGTAPLYKLNIKGGKSAALFGGAGGFAKTSATVNYAQPNTIIVLAKHGDGVANKHFFDGSTTGRHVVGVTAGPVFALYAGAILSGGASTTNDVILAGIFNGASSKIYVNGGAAAGSGDAGAQAFGNGAGNGIHLGTDDAESAFLPSGSYEYEVFVYNAAVSVANLNILGAQLNAKWGTSWVTAS